MDIHQIKQKNNNTKDDQCIKCNEDDDDIVICPRLLHTSIYTNRALLPWWVCSPYKISIINTNPIFITPLQLLNYGTEFVRRHISIRKK